MTRTSMVALTLALGSQACGSPTDTSGNNAGSPHEAGTGGAAGGGGALQAGGTSGAGTSGNQNGLDDGGVGSGGGPRAGGTGNDYYNGLAALAHRSLSLRAQSEIDAATLKPPNTWWTYDPHLDAARLHIPATEDGSPLESDLAVPVEFEQPTGTNTWVISFDVRWSDNFHAALNEFPDFQYWGQSKLLRVDCNDDQAGTGISWWKFEASFKRNWIAPDFMARWTQVHSPWQGPNVVDPMLYYNDFPERQGRWMRYWFVIVEKSPIDQPLSEVSVWGADEEREPTLVADALQMRMPWHTAKQSGMTQGRFRFSPKPSRITDNPTPSAIAVDLWLRNWLVLKNPGDIAPLLVRPIP